MAGKRKSNKKVEAAAPEVEVTAEVEVEAPKSNAGLKLKRDHTHKGVAYPTGTLLSELKDVTPSKVSYMRNNGVI